MNGDDDDGFSVELPLIRLPPLFLEDFRVLWPGGGDRPRGHFPLWTVVVVGIVFDVLDAVLRADRRRGTSR